MAYQLGDSVYYIKRQRILSAQVLLANEKYVVVLKDSGKVKLMEIEDVYENWDAAHQTIRGYYT